jgi:hypothetical protein
MRYVTWWRGFSFDPKACASNLTAGVKFYPTSPRRRGSDAYLLIDLSAHLFYDWIMSAKSAAPKKVPITERALFQRINRKLQQQTNPELLRTARSERQREALGNYFVVEAGSHGKPQKAASSGVVYTDVDLEKLGRRLGALQAWEELAKKKG